jgi:GDP-L-fucose synthase
MNKLITGGTGLIGSAFKEGTKIGSSVVDLRNYNATYYAIAVEQPEVVIHCAAKVGGVGANMEFPADFFMDNIRINTNVIQACYELKVPKLVSFLSTCVFPDKVEYPLDETKIELGPPHSSNFAYAYAKRMADIQIRAFNQQYNTQYFSVIPCNVYGPNDNYNLEVGHVIPMLIHKCYLAKKNNVTFEVWGDGTPLREFVYSKDVANIVDLLIQKYTGTEPVIISNPTEYSIKQVVDLIVEYMGFDGEVKWLTDKPNGQHRKPSSNAKLLSIIGDYEFTTLEKGLQESIEWFILNYPKVRK